MGRRQDEYRATLLGARSARLEDALNKVVEQLGHVARLLTEAANASKGIAEIAEAALARPQTVTPPPDGWIECTRCGDAYYGDNAGCPNRDKQCPMRGQNPKPAGSGQ